MLTLKNTTLQFKYNISSNFLQYDPNSCFSWSLLISGIIDSEKHFLQNFSHFLGKLKLSNGKNNLLFIGIGISREKWLDELEDMQNLLPRFSSKMILLASVLLHQPFVLLNPSRNEEYNTQGLLQALHIRPKAQPIFLLLTKAGSIHLPWVMGHVTWLEPTQCRPPISQLPIFTMGNWDFYSITSKIRKGTSFKFSPDNKRIKLSLTSQTQALGILPDPEPPPPEPPLTKSEHTIKHSTKKSPLVLLHS
jgi:hypothetical protein